MGKLTIKKNGDFEREYPLKKERVRVGRAPESDLCLDDPSVSGKHAMIITILEDSFVQDLGSTNGTYVNGESVDKQELKDGDLVRIGSYEFLFHQEDEEDDIDPTLQEDTDLERTLVVTRDSPTFGESSNEEARAIEEAEDEARRSIVESEKNTKRCFVKVMNGPQAGTQLEMKKPLVTLGRAGRQVAVISKRREGYFFTYVEGGDGEGKYPLVNGDPSGLEARRLSNNDIIELAGNRIQVLITDKSGA